jgi:K319-like protein
VVQSQRGWRMPFGGVCSPLPPTQREWALGEMDEVRRELNTLGDGDKDDKLQNYLRQPIDAAAYALKQARHTKGSTLPTIAAYYVESFGTRSQFVSGQLSAKQSAYLQHKTKVLRQLLLPRTQALARPKNLISHSQTMRLDGSSSASVDGYLPAFYWKSLGRKAEIEHADNSSPTVKFTSGPGLYTFELTIKDSFGNTSEDTVSIRYSPR